VLASLTPTAGIAGRGLLSCANTRFTLGRSSLQAAILLDAAEPGRATPVGLPGATSVPGRAALFAAPGREGTILARRAGRAWLLVEGAGLAARERLLSVLRAIVID
jgi:hypothetical protein